MSPCVRAPSASASVRLQGPAEQRGLIRLQVDLVGILVSPADPAGIRVSSGLFPWLLAFVVVRIRVLQRPLLVWKYTLASVCTAWSVPAGGRAECRRPKLLPLSLAGGLRAG